LMLLHDAQSETALQSAPGAQKIAVVGPEEAGAFEAEAATLGHMNGCITFSEATAARMLRAGCPQPFVFPSPDAGIDRCLRATEENLLRLGITVGHRVAV
jgi:hypothetical protein